MQPLTPGFADPVLDSQACFRAVLDAMARPGTIHTVAAPIEPPAGLDRATAAVLLTLVDADTPLWLDPEAHTYTAWLAFHCGAPIAPRATAAFALALSPTPLSGLNPGTDDGPEESATLILQVKSLSPDGSYEIAGPGLPAPRRLGIAGLDPTFVQSWVQNRTLFPRGIDLILCAGNELAALPRTLSVKEV